MSRPVLDTRAARRLFLHRHGLAEPPTGTAKGADLTALIERLGFVQVDSINTVERAHHMILFARRQSYRPRHVAALLEKDRSLFEHWTHDAAIIPLSLYPLWHLKFARDAQALPARWREGRRAGYLEQCDTILERIEANGPVCSADVGEGEQRGSGGWWDWHPSKTALEYLWRSGQLSVCHRESFRKFYDLTRRVIPTEYRNDVPDPAKAIDRLCNCALDRLGFATSGEIAAFWDIVTPAEARDWCARALQSGAVIEIDLATPDGPRRSLARPDVLHEAEVAPQPPGRMRVLSPFDPALRDRKRAERLFGFHYRIEVFTPAAKRRYGYYVFPLLEGDRLVGRVDMKADRKAGVLNVTGLWPERRVRWTDARQARFEAELTRYCRLAGVERYALQPGWLRNRPD
ncbi:winged helix-turn-helix domain-containing protein [Thalassococcus sp. BH17M4-6]|uniref:winged helix-turn-helix domain-containing protein n=1 Tax=Thalassococcus sp. BH17M4-6 TaxID=3413148 RepID=UPI003BD886A4